MVMPCALTSPRQNSFQSLDTPLIPDTSLCLNYLKRALLGEEIPDNNIKTYLSGMDCPEFSKDATAECFFFSVGEEKWAVRVYDNSKVRITAKKGNNDCIADESFLLATKTNLSTLSDSLFDHLLTAGQAQVLKDKLAISTEKYSKECTELSKKFYEAFILKPYFNSVRDVNPVSESPLFIGDTDGGAMGVLYALFMANRVCFMEQALPLLEKLTRLEQDLFNVMSEMGQSKDATSNLVNSFGIKIKQRDDVLKEMLPFIVLNPDAVTPCIFTGDMVNDRLSSPYSDSVLLSLIAKTHSVLLAGDHETCFKGNYVGIPFPDATQNNYPAIRELDFMYYDKKSNTIACHNGVTLNISNEGLMYLAGPYYILLSTLPEPYDPAKVVNAFNLCHRNVMDAASTHETLWSYPRYTDFSVGHRPSEEDLLTCACTLNVNQIHGHNGYGGMLTNKVNYVIDLNARLLELNTNKVLYSLHTYQFPEASSDEESIPQ